MPLNNRFRVIGLAILAVLLVGGLLAYLTQTHIYLLPSVSYLLGRNTCGMDKSYSAVRGDFSREVSHFQAVSRLLQKDPDGLQRWQTPLGEFWSRPGYKLFTALAAQSVHRFGNGPHKVRMGDIVVDCGSGIGDFVREALSCGAQLVVAVEPGPRNLACLQRTFAGEIASGFVRVVPKAAWVESGTMKMRLPEDRSTPADVDLVSIDEVVAELQLPRVDFIKMDIEGAEPNALRGARNTITRFRPRMAIATDHSRGEYDQVMKAVWSARPYNSVCGSCRANGLDFYPEVVFLTPAP